MTYRVDNPITRAVELMRVQEQQRLREREMLIDAACEGADEALRQFSTALEPVLVRLLLEVGSQPPQAAVPRDGADKLLELRIGPPGGARTAGEFYLDVAQPAAPWRLILTRPHTADFKTFEELLVGITAQPRFGADYTEMLASSAGTLVPQQIARFDAGGGRVIELHSHTTGFSRRAMVVGWVAAGVFGAGLLALLRLLGVPV